MPIKEGQIIQRKYNCGVLARRILKIGITAAQVQYLCGGYTHALQIDDIKRNWTVIA